FAVPLSLPHCCPTRRSHDLPARCYGCASSKEIITMKPFTAARLYKSTSNVDYVILPRPRLTDLTGGDYEELPLRVLAADESTPSDRKSTRLNSSHQIISYAV